VANYGSIITRAPSGSDPLIPEPLAASIIQEAPRASAALRLCRRGTMSTRTQRMPVLDMLPVSYWVGGDTGMKQTTLQAWKGVNLIVEELATIVPIPENYIDDAQVPLWSEVQPRLVESAGFLIDSAVFWGLNKPSTWGPDLYSAAVQAGNVVKDGFTDFGGGTTVPAADFGQSITNLGDLMAQTGYTVNGMAGRPGLDWRMAGIRSSQGVPIFQADMTSTPGDGSDVTSGRIYGRRASLVDNGSWDNTRAQLIVGDFSKAIIAIRRDISFKMFDQSVISNDSGQVILNLMQQDAVAMRMTMRLAYATVNPVTIMKPNATIDGAGSTTMRWPFGVLAS